MLQYLTPTAFKATPVGIGMTNQIAKLSPGTLEQLISRASERCNNLCKRRLIAPPVTQVSNAVLAGSMTLPIASTLGYDGGSEYGVIVGVGLPTQEIIPLQAGGVATSDYTTSPYPGTMTLTQPLQYAHQVGESVQGCFVEITESWSSNSDTPYIEAITQEAQLAEAHRPYAAYVGTLTHTTMLKNYPIVSLIAVNVAFPLLTQSQSINPNFCSMRPNEGFYSFPIGSYVPEHSTVQTFYRGGMANISDPVKQATEYYMAAALVMMYNIQLASGISMGKRSMSFSRDAIAEYEDSAELALEDLCRTV